METPIDYSAFEEGKNLNYWQIDKTLQYEVERTYPENELEWGQDKLDSFGETVGYHISPKAEIVEQHPPSLRTYDKYGNIVNNIEYHPYQLDNERLICESGLVSDVFRAPPGRDEPMSQTHSAAMELLMNFADTGLDCHVAMKLGGTLLLEKFGDGKFDEEIASLTTREYNEAQQVAMFLTEEQYGSDVGGIETSAREMEDGTWCLNGEKWFCSNLDAEIKFVLARRPGAPAGTKGISLFIVPSETDEGEVNGFEFRRLKDKLGTKTVPTGEVEFKDSVARLVGEPEEGYHYMTEMLNRTRLSVSLMGLGIVGRTLLESKIHAANRETFGQTIDSHPLMQEDLVDMAVKYEAALAVAFDTASAHDKWVKAEVKSSRSTTNDAFRRLHMLLPLVKYRATKLGLETAAYGAEVFGGNGVVSEFVTERMYRDAIIHPVWEGTSNIMALDVLRAMHKEGGHELLFETIEDRLDRVKHPSIAELAAELRDEYETLSGKIPDLLAADRSQAESDSKRVANYIYEVYAATLLLSEAQSSITEEGDARKAVVAERFADLYLRDRSRRIGRESMLAADFFDAIVRYSGVSPDELSVHE